MDATDFARILFRALGDRDALIRGLAADIKIAIERGDVDAAHGAVRSMAARMRELRLAMAS